MHIVDRILLESTNKDYYYHGSNKKFDRFNNIDNKTYQEIDIPSWHFTKDLDYAQSYGKYIYVVKLNIHKTFDTTNKKDLNLVYQEIKMIMETSMK